MKLLVVCSGNAGYISPFVKEQADTVQQMGVDVSYYLIEGKGIYGYFKNLFKFRKAVKKARPDLIHAHYGLSALLASCQFMVPVVATFHGSDVHQKKNLLFSRIAILLARQSIFVSDRLKAIAGSKSGVIIPCGVDTSVFTPLNKEQSRKEMSLDPTTKYILFSSKFSNPIKNFTLAQAAIRQIQEDSVQLIELNGYSRAQVALLMSAVDLALLTSFDEGSPQFIKEAMACNTPVVSTDVGDVKWLFGDVAGCYLAKIEISDVADKIKKALEFSVSAGKTRGRARVLQLDLDIKDIGNKLLKVYKLAVR